LTLPPENVHIFGISEGNNRFIAYGDRDFASKITGRVKTLPYRFYRTTAR